MGNSDSQEVQQEDDNQAGLFSDELYQHSTEDNLPEDITREFTVPENTDLNCLNHDAETIKSRATQPWEEIRNQRRESPSEIGFTRPDDGTEIISQTEVKTSLLSVVTDHIDCVVDEYKMVIRPEGLYIAAVDRSNVETIEVWFDEDDLVHHTVNHETTIGMSGRMFNNVLSHTRSETISFRVTDGRKLIIEDAFETIEPLIDPDSIRSIPNIPLTDTHYSTEVALPGVDLKEITTSSDSQYNTIIFETEAEEDAVVLKQATTSRKNVESEKKKRYATYKDLVEYRERSISQYDFGISVAKSTESWYSMDKVDEIFKQRKSELRTDYRIRLDDNIPMKIKRWVGEASFIEYTIAPKIKED
jgi:hypothetical protein